MRLHNIFKENWVYISSPKLRPLRNNLHVTYPDAPVYEADKTYNQVVSACLIHSPDGDFAITFCRATEYVSVLCWEESLNSVFMRLKLLLNHQALRVQHKDLPQNLTETWPTTTTNPDLKKEKEETMSCACVYMVWPWKCHVKGHVLLDLSLWSYRWPNCSPGVWPI